MFVTRHDAEGLPLVVWHRFRLEIALLRLHIRLQFQLLLKLLFGPLVEFERYQVELFWDGQFARVLDGLECDSGEVRHLTGFDTSEARLSEGRSRFTLS